jgi:serine/threonine protein kinase
MSKEDHEIGRLAIDRHLATVEEVEACLQAQADLEKAGQAPPLSQLLVERGCLTASQLDRLLSEEAAITQDVNQIPGYRLLEKIGQGAMGTVFKARQVSVDRHVAIKILAPRLSQKTEFVARMLREARAAAKLNHPNIIQAIDAAQAGKYHYFVMEYVEGRSVQSYLQEGKIFNEKAGINIAIQITKALQHAHDRGLIHRDVKPGNILLTSNGTAKLADLGLVRYTSDDETATSESGATLGTPYYISPEQVRGEQEIDGRADIYSLGATLFHMLTGRPPFEGRPMVVMNRHLTAKLPPPDTINAKLSNGICEVIEHMMAKHPKDRYANAADLLMDLECAAEGRVPVLAHKDIDDFTLAGLTEGESPEDAPAQPTRAPAGASAASRGSRGLVIFLASALVVCLIVIAILLARH